MKSLRKLQRITQKTVAAEIGIAERHYQKLEYGEITPGLDIVTALADFFDVSVDYLVGKTDDSKVAVAVAAPNAYHSLLFEELEKLGVKYDQIKQDSPRAHVVGEGFIIDDLTSSQAESVAKAVEFLINRYLVGRSDDPTRR